MRERRTGDVPDRFSGDRVAAEIRPNGDVALQLQLPHQSGYGPPCVITPADVARLLEILGHATRPEGR